MNNKGLYVLAGAVVVAAIIFAITTRYSDMNERGAYLDRWTGCTYIVDNLLGCK